MAGIKETGGKFATGINNTSGKILPSVPLVLFIPLANLSQCQRYRRKICYRWKICYRCQWRRWPYQRPRRQICHRCQKMGLISDCWQLKVNLKEKIYPYANSTTQRCPKEIMKTFLVEDFFHLPWAANISGNFRKIWNGPNGVIRGLGETDPCRKSEVQNLVALSLQMMPWFSPFRSAQHHCVAALPIFPSDWRKGKHFCTFPFCIQLQGYSQTHYDEV